MVPASDLLFSANTDDLQLPVGSGCPNHLQPLRATGTKVVVTIGPASQSVEMLEKLIQAGANVFRLNFSHGDHEGHSTVLANIRRASQNLKRPVAVLQDLCGPKIRISQLNTDWLEEGQTVSLTTTEHWNRSEHSFDLATNYEPILQDVQVGEPILINDGKLRLQVKTRAADHLEATVVQGGPISAGKGINLPQARLSTPSVTEKDWDDLSWGIQNQVDFVGLSFVRHAKDLMQVRDHLDRAGSVIQLIAKIERPEALDGIEDILDWCDGIMVARGDLALETDYARVPLVQKQLIQSCRKQNKTVITATQMLDSMVDSAMPTRAEVSDIANAILDGTDAVMLSNESAVGKYPVQAVQTMVDVSAATEPASTAQLSTQSLGCQSRMDAMAQAAQSVADRTQARAVVVYTQSGYAARHMGSLRMNRPVIACTNLAVTQRQLELSYGVHTVLLEQLLDRPQFIHQMIQLGCRSQWWNTGDSVVFLCSEAGCSGDINTIQVVQVD